MAILREKKEAQIKKLEDLAGRAQAITVAVNHGVTSNDMNNLRNEARKNNVVLMVAKNNLSKKVLGDHEAFGVICEDLNNPVMLGFSMEDLSGSTKLLGNYAEKNDKLTVTSAAIEGIRYGADNIKYVMNLPNREQALGMVVLGIQAPVVQLAGSLQELYGQFARALHAVAEQKQD